jgi:hypothetical protein
MQPSPSFLTAFFLSFKQSVLYRKERDFRKQPPPPPSPRNATIYRSKAPLIRAEDITQALNNPNPAHVFSLLVVKLSTTYNKVIDSMDWLQLASRSKNLLSSCNSTTCQQIVNNSNLKN